MTGKDFGASFLHFALAIGALVAGGVRADSLRQGNGSFFHPTGGVAPASPTVDGEETDKGPLKPPIVRTVIQKSEIAGTKDVLELILIEYQPGVAAAPHLHPVVGLNYILEGAAESQYEGEILKRFRRGDSYQDPARKRHLIFRNASATEPLRFLVACKIHSGESFAQPLAAGQPSR